MRWLRLRFDCDSSVENGSRTASSRSRIEVVTNLLLNRCICVRASRQYPNGRRDGEYCDIYWHGVHFSENTQLSSGKVNKFPGKWFQVLLNLNGLHVEYT